jgi:hypothetical protein
MVMTAPEPPSQAEGSRSYMIALYNIQCVFNGGLESALYAMKLMGVDCGIFPETKLTNWVYTCWSSGYNVHSTYAPSKWQGGISLFWRTSEMTKRMTCIPGNIRVAHTEEVYHAQQKGPINPTVKHHQVECDICGACLVPGSL